MGHTNSEIAQGLAEIVQDTDWELAGFVRENADVILAALRQSPSDAIDDAMIQRAKECAREHTDDVDIDWREILTAALTQGKPHA